MEFNKSGKQVPIGTIGGVALSVDGYEGHPLHAFQTEVAVGGHLHNHLTIIPCLHALLPMNNLSYVVMTMELLVVINLILDYWLGSCGDM